MSNWYVRRSRDRFWAKGMEQDKINAYMTLYTALVTICKGSSTNDPVYDRRHLSVIWYALLMQDAPESVHLCDFPEVKEDMDRYRS